MRPRAGVDIDGVIYEWDANARRLLAEHWGVDCEESTHYSSIREQLIARLGEETGRMADNWIFQSDAMNAGMWTGGEETPGAYAGLTRLSSTHEIILVTKRPRVAIPDTYHWLVSSGIYPTELIVIPESGRPKSAVACDWYVDDTPDVVEELVNAGRRTFLFDRVWNQDCQHGERVDGWDALLGKVLKP